MKYRPPTLEEISKRISRLQLLIGALCYLVFGLGGYWLAEKHIYDAAWYEIFVNVWWLPAGLSAWMVAVYSTTWIEAWVPEQE